VASLRVLPRDTPGERADTTLDVDVSEELALLANQLEEWVTPLEHWDVSFRQGHEFDRADNVEARLVFTGAEHTCSLTFRLDQVDAVQELDRDLWLTFDADDGIGRAAHLAPLGLDVELHHIVGAAFGRAGG
jgi:hypothetical protein